MTMGVRVFYSEISGSKEVKKRQQRVMMILESKSIPFEAIDITEAGKEKEKDFMLANAKPRGDSKIILAPQIFNDDLYCGDYDDFDLANENDNLEEFLKSPKIENQASSASAKAEGPAEAVNGKAGSREPSAETEAKPAEATNGTESTEPGNAASEPQTEETPADTSEEKHPEESQEEEAAAAEQESKAEEDE